MKNDFKDNLLESQLVKILLSHAMYDTMWRMIGFRDLDELPEKGKEGVSGRKYDKGFLYAPKKLISWDVDPDTPDIPIKPFSKPITIEEFNSNILESLNYDGATLISSEGIAMGRELDTRTLLTIAKHIALSSSYKKNGRTIKDMVNTLSPQYVKAFGGRLLAFTSLSVCLSYLDEFRDELHTNHRQFWEDYMSKPLVPVIGAAGKNLAQPHIISLSSTRHKDQYSGLLTIGGYDRRSFSTLTLEAAMSEVKDEMGISNISDKDIFARYSSGKKTSDIIGVLRMYHAARWGAKPTKESFIIRPSDLGLTHKNLSTLTEESFDRYSKILDKEKLIYPNIK
jgi:hypothetical protein